MTRIRMNPTGRGLGAQRAMENGQDARALESPTDHPTICMICKHAVVVETSGENPMKAAYCKLIHQRLHIAKCSDFVEEAPPSPV